MKLTATAMTALMVILTLTPVASANDKEAEDGHLSRTFLSWGSIQWKPHSSNPGDDLGGLGWYNPDQRDEICLFRLFGLAFNAGFYYEGLPKPRVTTNLIDNTHLLHIEENGIYGGLANDLCPFVVAPDQFLGTSAANVWLSPGFSQSALVCFKTFKVCDVNETTVKWTAYVCPWDETEFGNGDILGTTTVNLPPQVKGGIAMLMDILFPDVGSDPNPRTGNPTIGSSLANCDDDMAPAFNLTNYLNKQLGNTSSLYETHLDQVVPVGAGTSYVISCFSYKYTSFPANEGTPADTVFNGRSHDYFLVLDSDDPADEQAAALVNHELEPTKKGSDKYKDKEPDSIAEQGLYDLSGNNDCPFEHDGESVDLKKDKTDPQLGTIPRVIGP